MTIRVLLDTNVLFSARVRDVLLSIAEAGVFEPFWSESILEELDRNLKIEKNLTAAQIERLFSAMRLTFPDATVTKESIMPYIEIMTNDPKDRHVAAAAVVAQTTIIVTENLKDFSEDALAPYGIRAISSDDFLCECYQMAESLIFDSIQRLITNLTRPTMTLADWLTGIATQTPNFAALIQSSLK